MIRTAHELFEKVKKETENEDISYRYYPSKNHGDALNIAVYEAFENFIYYIKTLIKYPTNYSIVFILCLVALLHANDGFSQRFQSIQDQRAAIIMGGYQFLSEEFIQIGIGFQPQKKLIYEARVNHQRAFNGYVISALKSTRSKDWGIDAGYQVSSASLSGPFVVATSATYKYLSYESVFGVTPKAGLSIPFVDFTYSYFWQLSESSLSHSQHQLSLLFFVRFWQNFE